MSTGPTPAVREQVCDRDHWTCQKCGNYVGPFGDFSVHHRRPRGMGGSLRPETNLPANLIFLCGSGTTGCHGEVESKREDAYAAGFLVRQGARPSSVPVLTHRGWRLLADDATYEEVSV